ncbi:transposase [Spirosoma foliorum]|uniref:Transposase n=1 Tax=Spirosoma foliorum TaxID=2710596 RepID=A0A7G5H2V6_9BACT|nr:transposase [Spirosoma foliorum]QMW05448.1 transposase [Spirosoma foliorum]
MNQSKLPKRKYTAEFKADVLRLVANGEPIMAVARKMGISDSLPGVSRYLGNRSISNF